jgi:hypothetical protein
MRPKIAPVPLIFGLLFIGALAFGGYYFRQYQDLKTVSSKTPEEKNQELVATINKVYALPKDETPVVAIVSDEEAFKKEYPVFTTAKKGDSLLLYEKASQAILYRESENKIIGTATFSVRKGSAVQIIATGELQNSTEQTLTTKLGTDIRVSGKSTPVGQYTATTVVDLTGQKADLAAKIAEAVGGTVVSALPQGEKPSDGAEITVVVANSVAPPVTPAP